MGIRYGWIIAILIIIFDNSGKQGGDVSGMGVSP
jgi:hypothetical protein